MKAAEIAILRTRLERYASRLLANPEDRRDAVQNALISAHAHGAKDVAAYDAGCLTHRCIEIQRTNKSRRALSLDALPFECQEVSAPCSELSLMETVATLEPVYRQLTAREQQGIHAGYLRLQTLTPREKAGLQHARKKLRQVHLQGEDW